MPLISGATLEKRAGAILLHPTCLPGPFGIGDMGPASRRFADWLARAGFSYWQILPLSPTSRAAGNSPYHSDSAFAGNPWLISPELLRDQGWLTEADLDPKPKFPAGRVDFRLVQVYKLRLLDAAFGRFRRRGGADGLAEFCRRQEAWLEDYSLFSALRARFGGQPWTQWPAPLRDRRPEALDRVRREEAGALARVRFEQFLFHQQWQALRDYCRQQGLTIFGDLPIYVTYDSAEVWSQRHLFQLDEKGRPLAVAGVPPDYFSASGQYWGNPLYNWPVHQEQGFAWWLQRLRHNLTLYDLLRIDHFRGLVGYWRIPAGNKTAAGGSWQPAPADQLLETVFEHLPGAPLVAEDLGVITDEVRQVMARFGLPGMKVLAFAFGPDVATNPYAPHNIAQHSLVYTGTHDNDTVRGWFEKELSGQDRRRLYRYFGRRFGPEQAPEILLRAALMCRARLAVLPLQDVLGLGSQARMNRPGRLQGNWAWRVLQRQLGQRRAERLAGLLSLYGRAPS